MADKVFIGGFCPKFIICSDWFVNGNGIEWARVWRRFFSDGVGRRVSVTGWCVWVARIKS